MNKTSILFMKLGSIFMVLVICFGAFGAHALKPLLNEDMMKVYKTAVQYQAYHAIGLFIIAFLANIKLNKQIKIAGFLMSIGIVIFSGSLYALSLSGIKIFGAITPIGGLFFIAAWILLFLSL